MNATPTQARTKRASVGTIGVQQASQQSHNAQMGQMILVADDDPSLREILRYTLAQAGFE